MNEETTVWLVERTFSDDEQNLLILTYATPDGRWEHRKERAVTQFSPDATAADEELTVSKDDLVEVPDGETRDWYRSAIATRQDQGPD